MNTQIKPTPSGARRPERRRRRLLLMAAAASVLGLFVACSTLQQTMIVPPDVPGAEFVGNETCEACHEDEAKRFDFSVHARLHVPDAVAGESGCEACHGPGSKHADAGGGKGVFIVNAGEHPDACLRCHLEKKAEFSLPYRHPVMEGKMSCTDCHDPHGTDIKKNSDLLLARTNDTCAQCHKEQTGQHVFEHEALREGCTTCHNVHGSTNRKMLVENNPQLCLKCHAQQQSAAGELMIGGRAHPNFLSRGNCWSSGCHMAVHGSNVSDHMRY